MKFRLPCPVAWWIHHIKFPINLWPYGPATPHPRSFISPRPPIQKEVDQSQVWSCEFFKWVPGR